MTSKGLSVLFLTRYPKEGASSRYRVFQYVESLERLGLKCDVQSFMDESMYRASIAPGRTMRKLIMTMAATAKRLRAIFSAKHYDVVYLQRELLPFGPPWIERWLARSGVTLVFDYDDALFIKRPSRYNPIATFFRSPEKTKEMFQLVDCTIAGNDWLRDVARDAGGRAETIEVAEDTARFVGPDEKFRDRNQPVTIGWLGSPSTAKYLREIEPVLQEIAERHPNVRWQIMGSGDFEMDGVPWEPEEWSLEAERAALARYDIGLMPLPEFEWSRGKSGGKARTYMAAAVVPVVTAIGYNCELIRDGETGYLCRDSESWVSSLNTLITDRDLREKLSRAAHADVEARFSLRGQSRRMAELLRNLVIAKRSEAA